MKFLARQKGFTLIELLVVISIISLLATLAITRLNNARVKSRDVIRKADLTQIRKALDLYYDKYGKYPQAGACAYGSNCYVYSTAGDNWIPALTADGFMLKVPKDPKNNAGSPWTTGNYSYAYGNVSATGQVYDLTAQLENTSDPDRCAVKCYRWYFDNRFWCTGAGCNGSYSGQIYENSPP
jgi:prepilin-type N-terminal cleavage/methylation domain-containing protein